MHSFRSLAGLCSALPVILLACSASSTGPAETQTPTTTASGEVGSITNVFTETQATEPVAAMPELVSLSITGLTPAFSPSIHDYTVACGAGDNALSVAATAGKGVTIKVTQPVETTLGDEPTSITVAEDHALVIQAASEAGVQSYWVRCLPHDFPRMTIERPGEPAAGWYLLGNIRNPGGNGSFAMVLDDHGTPVWYRRESNHVTYLSAPAKNTLAWSVDLGPAYGLGVDPAGHHVIEDLAAGSVRYVRTVGMPTDHHELHPLPSGNFMLLSAPIRDGVDLSSRGLSATRFADCVVQEIALDGSLVWSWSASEHFDLAKESTDFIQLDLDGPFVDGFHCNAIDTTKGGDVLVSSRHMDAVFLVSRETGKVLWKLGGVGANRDGAQQLSMVSDDASIVPRFFHQHDVRFLEDGLISLFDNHYTAGDGKPARGLEIALDLASSTGKIVWSHPGAAMVIAMGSMRHTDSGSRIMGWGTSGAPAFTEVDGAGNVLLQMTFVQGDWAYRATKVPFDRLDVGVLRTNAGGGS